MSNPLFNILGGGAPQLPGQMGNMIQAFQQFRNGFTGNAQQQVQQMLNSGRMTQQQYNQLTAMADRLAPMFGIKK